MYNKIYLESTMSQVALLMVECHQRKVPNTQQLFHCIQGGFQLIANVLYHVLEVVIFGKLILLSRCSID